MAVSLASFQSIIGRELTPSKLMSYLDNTISPYTNTSGQNCALVYAEIAPISGQNSSLDGKRRYTLRAVNAGCIMPFVRRRNGTVEWVEAVGLPLGMGLEVEFGYTQQGHK